MQVSADQLADFAAALQASDRQLPHHDQRRSPRLDVRSRVMVSFIRDGQRQPQQLIRLRDLSPRGVALLHIEPIARGQQFILTLPRQDQPSVTILCSAVYCRPLSGRLHLIGAEFICTMNDAVPATDAPDSGEAERIRQSMFG
ncbi:MAG: PilZ domain-containing protein [Phycisphaerae bacterium]|nr:PilZ domain-containing protein [Phycisphaerae bacterium]